MTAKKYNLNSKDFPDWAEFNWIQFEIENSIDAFKKSVKIQQESHAQITADLHNNIAKLKLENSDNLDEQGLEQYVEHLYGLEERITAELGMLQNSSSIIFAFAIFENKLRLICEKLKSDFDFECNVKTDSYASDYWKMLKNFLDAEINSVEKYYSQIRHQNIVRHIIIHQNSVANQQEFKTLKRFKGLKFIKFQNSFYLNSIENYFIENLVTLIQTFFKELLIVVKNKTNDVLRNVV
ncbi:MAG: hypothetical protein CFE23_16565 [Flavobacterium sp. BFFFF1]|uniref:hypothetical protein n=1 Tax=Flavobacterium sp. BFFFF1 TaxID=2015557 RepID=UPI000BDCC94A|nr:hypothetical protein [Flavobacterium sp. BFFFF1]OYU78889.1 MAG: hypothetical protein CFE23_16565 [Flavobacterium sp. BFFFF1]